jgi:peptidoglycan/LPS O-acetylase OafA/YrhL
VTEGRTATPPTPSIDDRLPVLDGIRGLAIFMIMQYHFWGLGFGFVGIEPQHLIDRLASGVREVGWTSVDLFFVLSGFLITGILLDAKQRSAHYFRNFYARRFLRIFPLYYLFLVVVLALGAMAGTRMTFAEFPEIRAQQVWYWTYLVNVAASVDALHSHIPIVYSHFWTLAVEEQFYLVWPFVVLVLGRRALQVVCIGMIVGALCFRVAIVADEFAGILYFNAAHVLTPARIDALALGALVALAARGDGELARLARLAPRVLGICVVGIAALALWRGGLRLFDPGSLTLGFTLAGVLWTAILVLAITSPPNTRICRVLGSRFLTTFGRYSYCMYIVHILVGFGTAVLCIRLGVIRTVLGSQIPPNLGLCALATSECLLIAFVSWHLFEKQFLKLKVLFPYERGVVTAAARAPRARPDDATPQDTPAATCEGVAPRR